MTKGRESLRKNLVVKKRTPKRKEAKNSPVTIPLTKSLNPAKIGLLDVLSIRLKSLPVLKASRVTSIGCFKVFTKVVEHVAGGCDVEEAEGGMGKAAYEHFEEGREHEE